MKTLFPLLIFLVCASALHAEVSVLTEIEQLQEKLWYLQRDATANKDRLETQQEQLARLTSGLDQERIALDERLTSLAAATNDQSREVRRMADTLEQLQESSQALATELASQRATLLDQAGKLGAVEGSLQALRSEMATQQTAAGQGLAELRDQLAETRSQLAENRARIDDLGRDMGGRVEQIGYWSAGGGALLVILLVIVLVVRKSRESPI